MQPFSHAIAEPDRLMRMVALSAAIHLAMIAGLVVAELLAPPAIDFRDAIRVTLVPPSAPEARPQPAPDEAPPAPAIPKPPPPPPLPQTRREPVLAPLEDNPLWDKLGEEETSEESELARQFREMERAKPASPPPSAELERWWKDVMSAAPQPAEAPVEETPETPAAPSLREAFEDLRAGEKAPEAPDLIGTGEMTQWLGAQINMMLSPGDVAAESISDVERYQAEVKRRIYSHWSPPDLFQGSGAKVLFSFVIERDGRISEITLERTSGSLHFDDAARRALLTSGPFPPLPGSVKAPAVQVKYLFELQPKGAR